MSDIFNQVSLKESKVLKLIARTGFYVSEYNNNLGISKYVLNNCIRKGLIIEGRLIFLHKKLCKPYFLTEKGIEIVKDKYWIDRYRYNKNQEEHDFILCKIYLSLSDMEKESWLTETSLNMRYQNEFTIDALYTSRKGEIVGVEVLTSNYSKNEIALKNRFINKHCDKSIVIKRVDNY